MCLMIIDKTAFFVGYGQIANHLMISNQRRSLTAATSENTHIQVRSDSLGKSSLPYHQSYGEI